MGPANLSSHIATSEGKGSSGPVEDWGTFLLNNIKQLWTGSKQEVNEHSKTQ